MGETNGVAELDSDGDGDADDAAILLSLAITEAERRVIASQYDAGASIWRVLLPHLSTYDMNMGAGPDGNEPPPPPPDDSTTLQSGPPVDDHGPMCDTSGSPNSVVDCFGQVLSEQVPVAGTPYTLHYRSDRVPGRFAARRYTIPVRTAELDALLAAGPGGTCLGWMEVPGVQGFTSFALVSGDEMPGYYCVERTPTHAFVDITPAGQKKKRYRWLSHEAPPELVWTWDGKDDFGRTMSGPVPVQISVGYEYGCAYTRAARFGDYGGARLDFSESRTYRPRSDCKVSLLRDGVLTTEYWDFRETGVGGWSLDVNHRVAATNEVIYGDGTRSNTSHTPSIDTVFTHVHNVTAHQSDFAMTPNGTIYFGGGDGLYRQAWGGTKQLVLPLPPPLVNCNDSIDSPSLCRIIGVAAARNGDVYVSDYHWHKYMRIMRIKPDGSMQRIAGGLPGYSPEGGPALSVRFNKIADIEVASDGTIYLLDVGTRTIHRLGTDGMVRRIAGNGVIGGPFVQEADDARTVGLYFQNTDGSLRGHGGIALDTARGGLLVMEHEHTSCSIRHVSTTGQLTTTLRQLLCNHTAGVRYYFDAVVDASGDLILAGSSGVYRMDRTSSPPQIEHLAGAGGEQGTGNCSDPGFYPTRLRTSDVRTVRIGPDGLIYFNQGCASGARISRLRTARQLTRAVSGDAREVYEFDRDGRHQRTLSQLTGAELRRFEYTQNGQLAAIIEADGNETTIEYDANGRAEAIVAPFGQRTELELDANGYVSRVELAPHEPHQFEYDVNGLMTEQLDPRGSLHVYEHDALGRIVRDEDPAGGSFTFAVTNAARTLTVTRTSALGQILTYEYRRNPNGSSRYTVKFPTGRSNIRDIGVDGAATTTMIDGTTIREVPQADPAFGVFAPVGSETVTAPNGLVRTRTRSRTSSLASDGSANMTESLSDNGRISSRTFAPSTRTWTITSAAGHQRRLVLDDLARVISSDSAGKLPTTLRYDTRGRVDRVAQGSSRFQDFAFDPNSGYLASTTDALAQTTGFVSDGLGRVTSTTAPDQSVTSFVYDGESHITSITPPDRSSHLLGYSPVDLLDRYTAPQIGSTPTVTQTIYDLDRRPTTITQPDGLQQTFVYHPTTGLLTSKTVPGAGTTTFAYDTRDRLASATRPGAGSVALGYSGQLVTSQTVTGPHTALDGSTTIWSGSLAGSIQLAYDTAFNVKSVDVRGAAGAPAGFAAQYVRNADDGITSIAPLVAGTGVPTLTLTRSSLDGHVTATAQGVVSTTHEMDVSSTTPGYGDLKRLTATSGSTQLLSLEYQHDALGRIQRVDEVVRGLAQTRQYEYDQAGRLTHVRDGAGNLVSRYEYDGNGARVSVRTPTEQLDIGANIGCGSAMLDPVDAQDRLCRYGDYDYAYNANGQLSTKTHVTTGESTQYTYDGDGRLKSVVKPSVRIDYIHDSFGRRIGKVVNGSLSKGWLYQDSLRPVAQLNSAGQIEATFVYATRVNVPEYMVVRATGQVYRLIADHLGSVRLVVNVADGSIVQECRYDEFGNVHADSNPGFQPFGFAGGIYDADTGLVRFGARDYQAATGRWTAKDPILFEGGTNNLYEYVGNDPVNRTDPTGHNWFTDMCRAVYDWFKKGKNANKKRETYTDIGEEAKEAAEADEAKCLHDPGSCTFEEWYEAEQKRKDEFEEFVDEVIDKRKELADDANDRGL